MDEASGSGDDAIGGTGASTAMTQTAGPMPEPLPPSPATSGPEPGGESSTGLPPVPGTTGGSTTAADDDVSTSAAGDDGGEPGGPGPGAMPDPSGDVSLPSADVIAAAVYTDGELVDLRVQFMELPFTDQATYNVTWCIEAGGGGSGSCATHAYDIDAYLQLFQSGPAGEFVSNNPAVDPCLHGTFEDETNTLRILVPADEFPGTPDFRWILTVTFGGSFGTNEWVPEAGKLDVLWVDELPPFSGDRTC